MNIKLSIYSESFNSAKTLRIAYLLFKRLNEVIYFVDSHILHRFLYIDF